MSTRDMDGPGAESPAVAFSQSVVRLEGRLGKVISPALARRDLTSAELDVLGALRQAGDIGPIRPSELSARLLLTSGGLSNVLRRLEARGLLSRVPDPSDRRSHGVRLTSAGADAAHSATAEVAGLLQRALVDVPPTVLLEVTAALHEVLGALENASRESSGSPSRQSR